MNITKINLTQEERLLLENKYDILNDGFINFEEFVKNLNLEDSKKSEINKNNFNQINKNDKNNENNDEITKYEYDKMIN